MKRDRTEEKELVEFIMMVQGLDEVGIALLKSNAEMLASYEALKRKEKAG